VPAAARADLSSWLASADAVRYYVDALADLDALRGSFAADRAPDATFRACAARADVHR
jgi:hypothetical protein